MNIVERILKYVDFKGISITKFSKKINVSNAYFSKQKKNKANVGSHIIAKIVSEFPDVNLEWLITGNGEMLKKGISDGSYSNNVVGESVNMNNSNNNKLVADDNLFLENAFLKKEVKILREQLEMQKKFIEILEKK